MFGALGRFVTKRWPFVLGGWILLFAVLALTAPRWLDVVEDGEFNFLPDDSPSRQAQVLFRQAFPEDLLSSSVVIVLRRPDRTGGLIERDDIVRGELSDEVFIHQTLRLALENLQKKHAPEEKKAPGTKSTDGPSEPEKARIVRIRTSQDAALGELLRSKDGKAELVILELNTEFLNQGNIAIVKDVEDLLARLRAEDKVPLGLEIALSGAATVGRDMIAAQQETVDAIELWTSILVIFLLVAIYRAPLLALIPLITVVVATETARFVLSLLAGAGVIDLFNGVEVYIRVILYGAGVDYCLFLIARAREELTQDADAERAVSGAVSRVGAALTASAGTVICGIGMMVFARFGKFQQAGVAISLCLVIMLVAALTFTPALLRAFGRKAYWPRMPGSEPTARGWISKSRPLTSFLSRDWMSAFWSRVGRTLRDRPTMIWAASLGLMLPFAIVGVWFHDHLSYGLLGELRSEAPSVQGARAVQQHFSPGQASPITLLLRSSHLDFKNNEAVIRKLTNDVRKEGEEYSVADVYSMSHPLGGRESLREIYGIDKPKVSLENRGKYKLARELAENYYVGKSTDSETPHVTRIDVILDRDPFSRDTLTSYDDFRKFVSRSLRSALPKTVFPNRALRKASLFGEGKALGEGKVRFIIEGNYGRIVGDIEAAPREKVHAVLKSLPGIARIKPIEIESCCDDLPGDDEPLEVDLFEIYAADGFAFNPAAPGEETVEEGLDIHFRGDISSIRDLKEVTDADQIRIDILVLAGVYLILVILLRRPGLCGYLIFSVFISYLATLGVTFFVFWALNPGEFGGLDWKVPIFLFTILIAVGEDYNIFLMTRIDEEQRSHSPIKGILVAQEATGGIISSCGIIMAGTFASLMAGTLAGMQQLGFALCFGVLLDTFVVRPILVPAWLIMRHRRKSGGDALAENEDSESDSDLLSESGAIGTLPAASDIDGGTDHG